MSDAREVTIRRAELFELLWQQPMKLLAQRWGISPHDVVELCDAYSVPRPPNGYWSQLKWGTASPRPELPPLDGADLIELHHFRKSFDSPQQPNDLAIEATVPTASGEELRESRKVSSATRVEAKPSIVVAESLSNPHLVIRRVQVYLDNSANTTRGDNSSVAENYPTISVSKNVVPRALRILDAIYKHWESQGGEVREKDGALGNGSDFVTLSITETYQRVEKKSDSIYFKRSDRVSNGALTLEVQCRWFDGFRRRWSDGKAQKLEDVLGQFFQTLPRYLDALRQARLDEECVKRQNDRARKRVMAPKQEQEAEKKRRDQLQQYVQDWELAERIRRYLAVIASGLDSQTLRPVNPDGFAKWVEWALWYADTLCPLTTAKDRPLPIIGIENTRLVDLDVTLATKRTLQECEIADTDALYRLCKLDLKQIFPKQEYRFLEELDRVLSGLGYDMNQRDWVFRYHQ